MSDRTTFTIPETPSFGGSMLHGAGLVGGALGTVLVTAAGLRLTETLAHSMRTRRQRRARMQDVQDQAERMRAEAAMERHFRRILRPLVADGTVTNLESAVASMMVDYNASRSPRIPRKATAAA